MEQEGRLALKEKVDYSSLSKVCAMDMYPFPKEGEELASLMSKFIPKLAELKYPIRKARMRLETVKESGWTNEAEEALRRIKRKLGKLQTLVVPKEREGLMLCLRQRNETISFVLLVEREGIQILVSYEKSTLTPRAWRLYLGKETIEEGLGVGLILVSPEERMHSYAIRLKFNTFDHAIDYEALLAGLAVSISKGLATIKLEFSNYEVSMGIKTRPLVEETSSSKKGKTTSNVPSIKLNYNWEVSGSN
ncbi:hypothetical protein Tco_0210002 [Tanacetum coccineum]